MKNERGKKRSYSIIEEGRSKGRKERKKERKKRQKGKKIK